MTGSKKKIKNPEAMTRPKGRPSATRELVLTLSVPEGDVVKVEALGKAGQRDELSEEEFAALAGEDSTSP